MIKKGIIKPMKPYISELVTQAVTEISPDEAVEVLGAVSFDVSYPKPGFGDYATNAAMVMFKRFNTQPAENPVAFAKAVAELAAKYDKSQTFSKIESVGGFINFTLSPEQLAHQLLSLQQDVAYEQTGAGKKVVFEYSSPNTNKPLHIGHARNNAFGKACINLLQAVGHEVVSCEIINDRGIHIMKSVLMYMKYGKSMTPESEGLKPDHFVGKFYSMFSSEAAESEAAEAMLMEEAQDLLRRWEANDSEVRAVWKQMNDWFFVGVKETYAREGSTFDEMDFESEIFDQGRELVLDGVKKGIFVQEPDGSVSVDLEAQKLGKKYLLRKDGTTLYMTQDIYLWDQRNKRHQPDLAIVTTATEQSYHFQVLAHVFSLLGYTWANNFKHLAYEYVFLGQNKMSSRSGNVVSADELYDKVKAKVKETMSGLERLKGSVDDNNLVEQIAMGAVKFGYLHLEPQTRVYFDIDSTISLQGDTGPYVQYAHARIKSILSKEASSGQAPKDLTDPSELALMKHLLRYPDMVVLAARDFKPNLLANYLLEIARTFSTFYDQVSVLKETDANLKAQRLSLLASTANVLKNGLALLGIEAPEQM